MNGQQNIKTSQICFILEQHSTCFGRSLRPLSGV